jgi:signal recognition particle receptor subunit beta
MVLFNHATREMTAKIVYYGPGLCGKTTNLMVIFDKLDPKSKGKMLSLATKTDRTLFFDLLPVDIGKVGAFNLKIQLYTVPGQVFYNETRKLVLKGADAVVFVADSQPSMVDSTRESFANLLDNLEVNQIDINDTPIVIQFNKRDIPGVLSVEALQEALGFEGYPYTEAAAIKGEGVMETFKLVTKITAKHLLRRVKGRSGTPEAPEPPPKKVAAAKPAVKVAPEPEPEMAAPSNPFADSVPFPDSAPLESGYEAMEEVSLEQLVSEGRERPATFSGTIPVPMDDVEELGADQLVAVADEPLAVAFEEPEDSGEPEPLASFPSAGSAELEAEVQDLRGQIEMMKQEHRLQLQNLLQDLEDMAERVRARIDS